MNTRRTIRRLRPMLAQDKGGPSKGGFLNNQLFSCTDLYVCNEIDGMCIKMMIYYFSKIIYYSGNHLC